jgi:putative aldouronate transport system substrate-binding protein
MVEIIRLDKKDKPGERTRIACHPRTDQYGYSTDCKHSEGVLFEPLCYPVPVLINGEVAFTGHITPVLVHYASCYISSDNKDIEPTAKLLDYAYSKEGNLLINFDIPGESYELVDGQPQYTDDMLNHEDGFSNAVK